MNLKMILLIALLVVLLMGLMTYGYLTYSIYNISTATTGDVIVKTNQLMFYANLVLNVLAFGLAGAVTYKG